MPWTKRVAHAVLGYRPHRLHRRGLCEHVILPPLSQTPSVSLAPRGVHYLLKTRFRGSVLVIPNKCPWHLYVLRWRISAKAVGETGVTERRQRGLRISIPVSFGLSRISERGTGFLSIET